jgi:hypothetical protein
MTPEVVARGILLALTYISAISAGLVLVLGVVYLFAYNWWFRRNLTAQERKYVDEALRLN